MLLVNFPQHTVTMTSTPALSSATVAAAPHRPPSSTSLHIQSKLPSTSTFITPIIHKAPSISLKSAPSTATSATSVSNKASISPPSTAEEGVTDEESEKLEKIIGARVRVKVPLKVYHVPRVPELDLNGKEGKVKQYVGVWKGKRISANLPYKIEFVVEIEGRGDVKFFAHLKEDEFEFI